VSGKYSAFPEEKRTRRGAIPSHGPALLLIASVCSHQGQATGTIPILPWWLRPPTTLKSDLDDVRRIADCPGATARLAAGARPLKFASLHACRAKGGKAFRVIAQTDVPFLQLSTFQADLKDRYEIRLTLVPEKLKSGPVSGSIVILSNDEEFPRMTIPVKAVIEGSW